MPPRMMTGISRPGMARTKARQRSRPLARGSRVISRPRLVQIMARTSSTPMRMPGTMPEANSSLTGSPVMEP